MDMMKKFKDMTEWKDKNKERIKQRMIEEDIKPDNKIMIWELMNRMYKEDMENRR